MHNYFAIETEAEFRRQEWERAVRADDRSAASLPGSGQRVRLSLPRLSFFSQGRLRLPRLSVGTPVASRSHSAPC
jgi:hypothetical protein